jgi:tRNA modification GTPase
MDLSQAEGVADLIASESSASRDAAIHQLRGGFTKKIQELRDKLLHFSSMLELELDFSEEDVEFANRDELQKLLDEIYQTVQHLRDSYQMGNVIKNGVSVVIVGRPNAGKSTLLNALLNDERAIVSDIPGTTRDVVEDTITINGIQFRFSDTAGIRTSEDTIERIGVERTMQNLEKANLIIYLFDVGEVTPADVEQDLQDLNLQKPHFLVANKIDIGLNTDQRKAFDNLGDVIFISSLQQDNLEALRHKLQEKTELDEGVTDQTMVTNLRHYQALNETLESIEDIRQNFEQEMSTDFITINIRKALQSMGEITGEITTDEILGNIFEKFCIGK